MRLSQARRRPENSICHVDNCVVKAPLLLSVYRLIPAMAEAEQSKAHLAAKKIHI